MFFPSYTMVSVMSVAIPEIFVTERHELWYYIAGAASFLLLGVITGYFIWRRSHLQFAEIRHEKTHAIAALKKFGEEVEKEQKMLDDSEHELVATVKSKPKKGSKKPSKKPVKSPISEESSSQDSTMAIEPPENPVAIAMRRDAVGKPGASTGPSESEGDL